MTTRKKEKAETKKTIWEKSDAQKLEQFCGEYRSFISLNKTERECVSFMEQTLTA